MKVEVEIPDGAYCNPECPFFIEATLAYRQYCTLVGKCFKTKRKLAACPANPKKKQSSGV